MDLSQKPKRFAPQLKVADMISMGGISLIGLGLGALFSEHLVGAISALLVLGLIVHGLGMYGKFQIEREHLNPPAWVMAVFMISWIGLMIVALYMLIGRYVVIIN
jgi:hypothetical protein